MGRAEAFAMSNKPFPAFLDGLSNALGYGVILILVSIFREIFGSGTLLGFSVIPQSIYDGGYINNGLMLLAPGAFIVLGLIIWVQRTFTGFEEEG
jgi:Na+-transporting NADH:ubiquinone oxidoreductase subunit D